MFILIHAQDCAFPETLNLLYFSSFLQAEATEEEGEVTAVEVTVVVEGRMVVVVVVVAMGEEATTVTVEVGTMEEETEKVIVML